MKKMILLVCSMLIILFTSCKHRSENNPYDNKIAVPRNQTNQISQSITNSKRQLEYEQSVSKFSLLSPSDLLDENFTKPLFIYFGFSACPYCLDFAPKLSKVIDTLETNPLVYYFDINPEINNELIEKIAMRFHIYSVPSLIYLSEYNEIIFYDDNITLEEWMQNFSKD